MRPKQYPYSGKRRNLERQILRVGYTKASSKKSNNSSITFRDGKIIVNGQSIIGVLVPSGSKLSGLLQST